MMLIGETKIKSLTLVTSTPPERDAARLTMVKKHVFCKGFEQKNVAKPAERAPDKTRKAIIFTTHMF